MKEVAGNIWDYHNKGHWIVITTNGSVRKDGCAVMGRGVALQVKQRFPDLPYEIGRSIQQFGNHVYTCSTEFHIIAFPVKHSWNEKADIKLIEQSCCEIAAFPQDPIYFMVRPGCGNGGLEWKDVKPILEKHLDDRFVVVELPQWK